MKPYYQDKHCTIYHGDCREILPTLEPVDLVLTDPPYGIDLNTKYSLRKSAVSGRDYSPVLGDSEPLDFAFLFNLAPLCVVFGANNWPQQIPFNNKRDGWLCWDKRVSEKADAIIGSPFELACVTGRRLYKIIRLQHCGIRNADGNNAGRFHPTQKPVVLLTRILSYFPTAPVALDPFMGSGTTLRAAKDLGRKAIGIELEEKYCEIAAKRLRQEVLDFGSAA